jgi:hypothetical protein
LFPDWREATNSFNVDVSLEIQAVARDYIEAYRKYSLRIAAGDYKALLDSPITSSVVETLLYCLPDEMPPEERFRRIGDFFRSAYFSEAPCKWLSARICATLKDMVKRGAYANREDSIKRLSGFFHDVQHVAIYAPYCDAFVMDQTMASLVDDPHVGLENRYKVKVFSLNNWDQFLAWLDGIERGMSQEHRTGLNAAYP